MHFSKMEILEGVARKFQIKKGVKVRKKLDNNHITMVVADDHEIIVQAISNILASTPNITIIGKAFNGEEAIQLCHQLKPDILLIDIQMPAMNGLAATKIILKKNPKIKVIVFSAIAKSEYVEEALIAGASGYIVKSLPPEKIIEIINSVLSGEKRFFYGETQVLTPKIMSPLNQALFSQLSEKELEVLELILIGYNLGKIAKLLLREERTIRIHREKIRKKLGVKTDVELFILAIQAGFYVNE